MAYFVIFVHMSEAKVGQCLYVANDASEDLGQEHMSVLPKEWKDVIPYVGI